MESDLWKAWPCFGWWGMAYFSRGYYGAGKGGSQVGLGWGLFSKSLIIRLMKGMSLGHGEHCSAGTGDMETGAPASTAQLLHRYVGILVLLPSLIHNLTHPEPAGDVQLLFPQLSRPSSHPGCGALVHTSARRAGWDPRRSYCTQEHAPLEAIPATARSLHKAGRMPAEAKGTTQSPLLTRG